MEKYNFGEDEQFILEQNLLGITNLTDLALAESYVFIVRSLEIAQGKFTIQQFDLKALQQLHFYLFGELYKFAGEIRTVQLMKGSTRFCHAQYILDESTRIFKELQEEQNWQSVEEAAKRLAYFKAELNMLHPFREGNGRSIRIFLHEYAKSKGFYWAFEHLQQDAYMRAMIQSVITSDELEQIFKETLKKLNSHV